MEQHWHEVLIQNDEGDNAFAKAAPLMMEALQLVASTRALQLALGVACCKEELSRVNDTRRAYRAAREEARELHNMLEPHLESVYNSMLHLRCVEAASRHPNHRSQKHRQRQRVRSLLKCHDGLVAPRDMRVDAFLDSQPVFDYKTFRARFGRLCQVVANGQLFSACEPRIKVLQSRYRLYRAFNSGREDQFHPTLGGGSFRLAPKVDVRRISSCMSATTLVEFMQRMLEQEPNLVLHTHGVPGATEENVTQLRAEQSEPKWRNRNDHHKHSSKNPDPKLVDEERDPTLKELVDVFFGPFLPPEERCFTPDGLGLLPNYTGTSERMSDTFDIPQARPPVAANAVPLLRHFLDVDGGNGGDLLARLVRPMLSRIATSDADVLELEFTVTGLLAGEVQHIAAWCVRSGLIGSRNAQLSLRIMQKPLCGGDASGGGGSACNAKTLEDVLMNIFEPIWLAMLQPQEYQDVVKFLARLVSVGVSVSGYADVQEMPATNSPKMYSAESGTEPPDAFFIYHVWRNVQVLNCMVAAHVFFSTAKGPSTAAAAAAHATEGESEASKLFLPKCSVFLRHEPVMKRPLLFRLHASATSKNAFVESVIGLLIADVVVNPVEVFAWSPLAYLYYLTQRSVLVTPSRNHNVARDSVLQRAVPFVVETGLNASVATLDPLHYHTNDNALLEELSGLQKNFHLALADMTELCLHSAESANWAVERRGALLGEVWGRVRALHNDFTKTQVNALRLRLRESSLAHEMDLLCRKGLTQDSALVVEKGGQRDYAVVSHFPAPRWDARLPGRALQMPLREQREAFWRFFGVPHARATDRVECVVLGHHFVDRQIAFPRIVISGPSAGEKSSAARKVVAALLRRQYYRDFSVHCEPPVATQLRHPQEINALLASQHAADFPSEYQKQEKDNHHQHQGANSSSQKFFSPLEREQRVNIPNAFRCQGGVRDVVLAADANDATKAYFRPLPTWKEFQSDTRWLRAVTAEREAQLYTKKRLGMLECKFNLHVALTNDDQEQSAHEVSRLREKGDLYKSVKVDVHCHMAAGITAKDLLRFIKKKAQTHANDVVDVERGTGRLITLGEMFAKLRAPKMRGALVNVEELTVASLEVKAGKETFNRFDEFNGRYSPLGNSALRTLFLKTENFMGGRYFAELIRETFNRQAEDGCTFSEYRLSIYGRHRNEWDKLSRWFVLHGMSHPTNRWMVQVPRLYSIYRSNGIIASFEEMLTNIFVPLWEASISPESHPFLNYFLAHLSGFDSVDNESEREPDALIDAPPERWTHAENPPFSYWMYYMWANITTLNRYRAARGLSTFSFRPHAGESGDPYHMADVFLVADGVNHGINLKDLPVMQYLFYLAQIPLGITPLSNNALFCKYHANPFPTFFRRGLNVALATDGALIFHHTEQPLIEEYSTAVNFWNLSLADVCEIARNSVLMSGFPSHQKKSWLGNLYALRSAAGNDVRLSKVPQTRCTFRYEVYVEEMNYLQARAAADVPVRPVLDAQLEGLYTMDAVGLSREAVIALQLKGQPITTTTAITTSDAASGCSSSHSGVSRTVQCVTAHSQL
ncbi:AMP deaminase [Trypanosoma grayi]|uniref:AMP deaminase n=1 Tax=Trypanosoma grayi TaxID=71804 RepID=UPI0004F4943F|nr:AMP deaminase [Trypanosoma grayi]KEG08479.1 AMP deaminase [Trypanosoma grayi]